jgi:hypothetical protein
MFANLFHGVIDILGCLTFVIIIWYGLFGGKLKIQLNNPFYRHK